MDVPAAGPWLERALSGAAARCPNCLSCVLCCRRLMLVAVLKSLAQTGWDLDAYPDVFV